MNRLFATLAALFLFCVMAMSVAAQISASQKDSDAEALLESTAETMLALDSFHFEVTTPTGKTSYGDLVELVDVNGDVVRPDKFRAEFKIGLAFVKLNLNAIGIGTNIWVTNPLESGGEYVQVSMGEAEALPPLALLNPDELIRQAMNLVENPSIAGEENLNGVATTKVVGTFDASELLEIGTPVSDEALPSPGQLGITFWIDSDNRIVRLELAGAFLPGEDPDADVIRRIDLSAFNVPVEITLPQASA